MASSTKTPDVETPDVEAALALQAITSHIASLKHDLAALTRHLKLAAGEKTRAAPQSAIGQISERSCALMRT
jgi:hypothetical protein